MTARRLLLVVLVGAALYALTGCGVTQWQRDQDAQAQAFADLHSPEMEARIREAQLPHTGP